MSIRTFCSKHSATPTLDEIEAAAEKFGVKRYSPSLVVDFVHFNEGGGFYTPSEIRAKVINIAKATDLTNWKQKYQEMMAYHSHIRQFVSKFPFSKLPGENALQKAVFLMKLLEMTNSSPRGGEDFSEDDESSPFSDEVIETLEEDSDPTGQIEEILDALEGLDEETMELLSAYGNQQGQSSDEPSLKALAIAEALMDSQIRIILEVSRELNQISKFSRTSPKVTSDPEGFRTRTRPIRGIGEIGRLKGTGLAQKSYMPRGYFYHMAMTGQIKVQEKVTITSKKQAIFILMDVSGSTSRDRIRNIITGVVMNRLKAVMTGDAEVHLGLFDSSLRVLGSATNPEEAQTLMSEFRRRNYTGGGTDIASGIRQAHKYLNRLVEERPELERPAVIVLTDEDGSARGLTYRDIPGTTVHGFACQRSNPSLVAFAKSTGGIGVENFGRDI